MITDVGDMGGGGDGPEAYNGLLLTSVAGYIYMFYGPEIVARMALERPADLGARIGICHVSILGAFADSAP